MNVSEGLSGLSARAKEAEQRVSDAHNQAKGELEQTADEARVSAQAQADKLRESANAAESKISSEWNDLQTGWNEHLAKVRQTIDEKKAEHDIEKAKTRAEYAEQDALFAIDYAYATIEGAEYAVLDAILARAEAEEFATAGAAKS